MNQNKEMIPKNSPSPLCAIIKKELRIYFNTPIAWVFIAVMFCVGSILFTILNLFEASSAIGMVLLLLPWVFVVMTPLLTMRLIAEERGLKTDQLLLTSPISVSDIVWGKLIAALAVFGASIVLMLMYPIILEFYSSVEWGVVFTNYLGFFLLGSSLISIGLFISSLTENQFTAAVITIAVLLAMFLISSFSGTTGIGVLDFIIDILKITRRFDSFYTGFITLADFLYYVSITVVFVLLTVYRIEKRKIK